MTTNEAIKISLSYHTAVKALEILSNTLRGLNFDDMTSDGQNAVKWISGYTAKARNVLDGVSDDVREMETFNAQDEQEIDDLVCAIEDTLNGIRGYLRTKSTNPVTRMDFELAKKMAGYHNSQT